MSQLALLYRLSILTGISRLPGGEWWMAQELEPDAMGNRRSWGLLGTSYTILGRQILESTESHKDTESA